MYRKSDKEGEMKTGIGLRKRTHPFGDLFNSSQINSTIISEKASRAQKVIKKRFADQFIAKKKCGNMPGRLCVLVIVQNSEEGIDPRTVKQMTGFNRQKVHRILYKLFKHGEIRIKAGGLYVGVNKRYHIPMVN
jgi:hypothetical protein